MAERPWLRLLADDLTGALDSGAAFASDGEPVPVYWPDGALAAGTAALDLATREGDRETAAARHRASAAWLAEAEIPFKKIDSLLRGHVVDEVVACMADGLFDRAVVAPAFPSQQRVTRGGKQFLLGPDGEAGAIDVDLARGFGAAGVDAVVERPGCRSRSGVTIVDAETDVDLDLAVARARCDGGRTLWVGAGGLASALARSVGLLRGSPPGFAFDAPLLVLVGTNHPVTVAQIRMAETEVPGVHVRIRGAVETAARAVEQELRQRGAAILTAEAGPNPPAPDALGRTLGKVASRLTQPFILFVAGGETLRAVAQALGASHLSVLRVREPGVPLSVLEGGSRHGTRVLSKSGAFGGRALLRDLITAARSDLRILGKV